eukprot:3621346-Rhodomonas_salina.5
MALSVACTAYPVLPTKQLPSASNVDSPAHVTELYGRNAPWSVSMPLMTDSLMLIWEQHGMRQSWAGRSKSTKADPRVVTCAEPELETTQHPSPNPRSVQLVSFHAPPRM